MLAGNEPTGVPALGLGDMTPVADARSPLNEVALDDARLDKDVGAAFINAIKLPLRESLLQAPPTRVLNAENWIPRRSDRLAAKSVFRDLNPEKQDKRVLVNKWEGRLDDAVTNTPDASIAIKFHEAFDGPVSGCKRECIRALFHDTHDFVSDELEC
jgi:hypothetical protein